MRGEELRAAAEPVGPAEVLLPCSELAPTLEFFTGLGFRVETIFPAEDPEVASLSGYGLRLRLEPGDGAPGRIRIGARRYDALGAKPVTAPNGTAIEFVDPDPPFVMPPFQPEFVITRREGGPAEGQGRAGMTYRDLIPSRLGGRYIASHISIPEGGPVSDWAHYHKIGFQMIFVRRGWVRVAYEDQGPEFVMEAHDCVLQPPRIRHRVLESSPGFEVVEIGCPALHETLADPEMVLPTGRHLPDRDFGGQRFLRHIARETPWRPVDGGFEAQVTGMYEATGGIARVRVLRPAGADAAEMEPHDGELLFGFLLEGSATLDCRGRQALGPADAFVIPPGEPWGLRDCTRDLSLLEVRTYQD
ncbi:MAG TPA: hypothetical protein VF559_12975 [Caulobacteraceae bacterium]|jgi:mannose-6-phosphate isomerase-like protein (cupin superfamily)